MISTNPTVSVEKMRLSLPLRTSLFDRRIWWVFPAIRKALPLFEIVPELPPASNVRLSKITYDTTEPSRLSWRFADRKTAVSPGYPAIVMAEDQEVPLGTRY